MAELVLERLGVPGILQPLQGAAVAQDVDRTLDSQPSVGKGDLPSWIAVAIALVAVVIATRKPRAYSELNVAELHFDSDGGKF